MHVQHARRRVLEVQDGGEVKVTLDMVQRAYFQATNVQKETKEIIQRLYEELNREIEQAEEEAEQRKKDGPYP